MAKDKPTAKRTRTSAAPQSGKPAKKTDRPSSLVLERTVIAMPLFEEFKKQKKGPKGKDKTGSEPVYPIIIDIHLMYHGGRVEAKKEVQKMIVSILNDERILKKAPKDAQGINPVKTSYSQQYVFAVLEEHIIKKLVERDLERANKGQEPLPGSLAIYHIWPDFEINPLTTKSVVTVKADAARNAFSALGEGIYWAVIDSGIDGTHPHFIGPDRNNLKMPDAPDPLQHRDFTILSQKLTATEEDILTSVDLSIDPRERPLVDELGHGTHVAGIIAGELKATKIQDIIATTEYRDESGVVKTKEVKIKPGISGMAPNCKLVSLKVFDKETKYKNRESVGYTSNLIAAIQWIQEINGYGRRIRIHGVNMSVGYEFKAQWFACGQSPLCVEVDRLVKTGVVVVVAAGNTGYGFVLAQGKPQGVTAGLGLTINDPGNADLAITVGATHREMPHVYGVSYFSSKGPTGDGRLKPDLVAPGEKIISCDSAQRRATDSQLKPALAPPPEPPPTTEAAKQENPPKPPGYYREESGTSMAAPHVSGVIAAFLSVRREFIGRPETVKEIFLSTATDLKRERYFQGHGLVDLMRAIQSV
ncbi:MAG: S8 family peptidase [Blastocatellia bacterium]